MQDELKDLHPVLTETAIEGIADDARRDLDEALLALDAAIASIKSPTRYELSELSSFPKPPSVVITAMAATCIMFREKAKMKDDPNHPVEPYMQMADFTIPRYPRFQACKPPLIWVRDMYNYHNMALLVASKRAAYDRAQVLLAEAQAKLGGMKVKVPCNNENKSDADEDEDEESDVATSSEKTIFSPGKRMTAGED
eukprot:gene28168-31268_t